MLSSDLVDGRRRSYVTLPGHNRGMKPPNAGQTYPVEIPTGGEVLQLMAALGGGPSGTRYRAAVVLMYRCGLRVSEALALEPKDVDLAGGTVTVLHGKGNQRRVVGIDPAAAALVEKWLIRRREMGVGPGKPIVCLVSRPRVGEPIHASVLREAMKDAAGRAGIEKRMNPHCLRHTFAVEFTREGGSLILLQRALGHRSLGTTERYLRGIMPWESIDAVRARTWVGAPAGADLPGSTGAPGQLAVVAA